jgi:tetratricopeptide (TPR) repeat protein
MAYRYLCGLLGLWLWIVAATPAAAQQAQAAAMSPASEEQARAHLRLGRAHYDNGNFAQAAVEFEEAYRISQRAALLYNIYLAYRDANDTHNAAEALRKYLALEKEIENRGQLEARLAALDRAIAAEPKPATAPAAGSGVAASEPTTALEPVADAQPEAAAPSASLAASESSDSGGFARILPIVLMGTGGAMMAASIVTGLRATSAHSELSEARDSCEAANNCTALSPERAAELNDLKSSGQTMAMLTDILLFGGIAVAGTGAVLFFIDRGASERATAAALSCSGDGCQGRFTARF